MRGRRALVVAMAVVAVGVLVSVAAYYLDPGRGAVGPMPGVGFALPAQTRMVAGLSVRQLAQSTLYRRFFRGAARPQVFTDLQTRTGIDPENDVERLLFSYQGEGDTVGSVAIAFGSFDRERVTRTLESGRTGGSQTHEGRPLYVFEAPGAPATAAAFLEDDVLALGTRPQVEQTVTGYVRGPGGFKGNAAMMALVQSVRPGVAFWAVGDQTLLARLSSLPVGGGLPAVSLPGLKSVVLSGEVEPAVSFEAVLQTADEKAAQQISGIATLILGMARMQGSQRPELQQLASSVAVTTDKSTVRVNGRFSDELLEALQRRVPARPSTPRPPPPDEPGG